MTVGIARAFKLNVRVEAVIWLMTSCRLGIWERCF